LKYLRAGDYRVLYRLNNGLVVILVVPIGHRSAVYDN
jgi:mRNA-degrading endonuclease RelE of RelBE toxin-antitoxin system